MSKKVGQSIDDHNNVMVEDVEKVMVRLRDRSRGRATVYADKVSELDIHWSDRDNNHNYDGWYAKIDGKEMYLEPNAVKTGSKLIKIANPKYWNQFTDRNAFPASLRHIIDNKKVPKGAAGRIMVRHNGERVQALLHPLFQVRDAYEMIQPILQQVTDDVGQIRGISSIENGDIYSYRIIVGQNFIPNVAAKLGQYMMSLFYTSEVGACETGSGQGIFRNSCTNSGIFSKSIAKWSHRGGGGKFNALTAKNIRHMGYYQGQYGRIFGELLNTKLEVPPSDILAACMNEKLITSGHYDACRTYVDAPTEDGRPVETQYDLFNVLTRAAQDMTSIKSQQKAETTAMELFTSPGGIFKQIESASRNR